MRTRTCPNCGTPVDAEHCKCPYCGMNYFDFNSFEVDDNEPFYLNFKFTHNGKNMAVTALVAASPMFEIGQSNNSEEVAIHFNVIDTVVMKDSEKT